MEKKKQKKNNTSVDLEKSIEILNNRMDCSMCSISSDMADVLTRVHKLEDNQSKDIKEKDPDDELNNRALSLCGFLIRGLAICGFICLTLTCVRDIVLSIIGA